MLLKAGWCVRTKTVVPICMFCSAMFAGGNVFYALLGLLPRGDVKLRVWMMLVSRFIVGSGTGKIKLGNMTEF